jgi:hypothetical protein
MTTGSRTGTDGTAADQFGWLLSHFTRNTPGVVRAVAVSPDGRLLATADGLTRSDARRLAVLTASISNLADGAGHACDAGAAGQILVKLERGYVVVKAINPCSLLGVHTGADADLAELTFDVTALVSQIAAAMTPELVDELATAHAVERG